MAVTSKVYYAAITSLANKEIDWGTDVIKCALFTNALTITQSTNQYFDAAPYTSNQVAGTNGYQTGGQTLTTKTEAYSGSAKQFKADNVQWTSSTITARYAVIYDDSPGSNKPLISYVDFGQDVSSAGGNYTITWDSTGVFTVTVS